jgi:hypothetical protein
LLSARLGLVGGIRPVPLVPGSVQAVAICPTYSRDMLMMQHATAHPFETRRWWRNIS